VRDALIKNVDLDVGITRRDEQSEQAPGAVIELRRSDERSAAADPEDLPVILEDRKRLTDDDPADAQRTRERRLGRARVPRCPDARFDPLLQELLKLIVQGHKARSVEARRVEGRQAAIGSM